jgi:hypothetical protein
VRETPPLPEPPFDLRSWSSYRAYIRQRPLWTLLVSTVVLIAFDVWVVTRTEPFMWIVAGPATALLPVPFLARWTGPREHR